GNPDGLSPGDFRGSITAPGVFDRTYDLTQSALVTDNQLAALDSVFVTINWLHDFWYDAGFTEAAGNAQTDNYGRGRIAGDPLHVELERNKRNNAKMTTPSDGMSPKLELYVWTGPSDRSIAVDPADIDPIRVTNVADFGPASFDLAAPLAAAATD